MRRHVDLIAACSMVLAAAGCGSRSNNETPRALVGSGTISPLVVEPAAIDLGEMPLNTQRSFSARITNRGAETIKVKNVLPNCGCADIRLAAMELDAGGTTELTGKFLAGPSPGRLDKQLLIELEKGAPCIVEIRAHLIRTIEWSPDAVVLTPDVISHKVDTASFTITNRSSMVVKLLPREAGAQHVGVECHAETIEPGSAVRVSVTAGAEAIQPEKTTVALATSHPLEATLQLRVDIRPKHPVEVTPAAVHVGIVSKAELMERKTLEIVCRGSTLDNFQFQKPDAPTYLRMFASDLEVPDTRRYRFEIVDSFRGIDLSGTIKLLFAHRVSGHEVVIQVPISGFLMGP